MNWFDGEREAVTAWRTQTFITVTRGREVGREGGRMEGREGGREGRRLIDGHKHLLSLEGRVREAGMEAGREGGIETGRQTKTCTVAVTRGREGGRKKGK